MTRGDPPPRESESGAPARPLLLLLSALLIAPWGLRVALVATQGGLQAADLRGFLADSLLAVALVPVVWAIGRRSVALALIAVFVWWLTQAANHQHVAVLGAPATFDHLRFAVDRTFLLGSVLHPSQPWTLLSSLAASLSVTLVALYRRFGGLSSCGPFPWRRLLASFTALAAGVILLPAAQTVPLWRTTNHLVEALRPPRSLAVEAGPDLDAQVDALFEPDLRGWPLVAPLREGTNVLLVLLEGISGAHLPRIADHHRRPTQWTLPAFDALLERGLWWPTFISQQRQTNRGEYSLLCGDYPRLDSGAPKMTAAIAGGDLECLPRILRRAGYGTVYLQSAPLGFMAKDQFMPRAGFDVVEGASALPRAYARSPWGVDDRAFFEQALERIAEIDVKARRWFVTLLTSGTHHPMTLPASLRGDDPLPVEAAMAYLDRALVGFLGALTQRGISQRTLVLISADESFGYGPGSALDPHQLAENWGFLVAFLPGDLSAGTAGSGRRQDGAFAQTDLAISVLDILGLAGRDPPFLGRSVFRHYPGDGAPRTLAFGNTLHRSVSVAFGDGVLYRCRERSERCQAQQTFDGNHFDPEAPEVPVEAERVALVRAIAARAATSRAGRATDPATTDELERSRTYPLVQTGTIALDGSKPHQILFNAQAIAVPSSGRVLVSLDLEIVPSTASTRFAGGLTSNDADPQVELDHDISARRSWRRFVELPPLERGDRLQLASRYSTKTGIESLSVALRARGGDPTLALRIRQASVEVQLGLEGDSVDTFTPAVARLTRRGQTIDLRGRWSVERFD